MRFLDDGILRLRALEPDDAECMLEIENDSTQWLDNGMCAPFSSHLLRTYAESYDNDPFRAGQIRLIAESSDEIVGIADLYDISLNFRTAFVGIYIRHAFRDSGYSRRALSLLEGYAYSVLNLRIVAAKISASNIESLGLFEKCGYTHAGTLSDWLYNAGKSRDLLIYTKKLYPVR